MCIVTTEELEAERQHWLKISKTNIFARHARPTHQLLAYGLSIASPSAAAMILPLPVSRPSDEDALRFIDLSGHPRFFEDLSDACEPEYVEPVFADLELGAADRGVASVLAVHEVGDFEASYVPAMADFTRLDPRFRLPDRVWRSLPDYADYGFAVFQLKLTLSVGVDSEVENEIHPMAFEFPTRDPSRLYFPTVHVHDGSFHATAGFYHTFYCQRDGARAEFKYQLDLLAGETPTPAVPIGDIEFMGYPWYRRSTRPAGDVVPVERCEGLLDPDAKLHAMSLFGEHPNRDIWLGDSLGA